MLSPALLRSSIRSSFPRQAFRSLSTLPSNPHIYIHGSSSQYIFSLLPTSPPSLSLSLGTSTQIPLAPDSFTPNPQFLTILNDVLQHHATSDPWVQSQAAAFASSSNAGGSLFGQKDRVRGDGTGGAGGASNQGGAGGGGRGGWIHVSDLRAPPDYGRIAWPEDIFGSLEVDRLGRFVVGETTKGNWQASGTYRIVTREGVLGLSDFLRGKLVERLRAEEEREKE